MIDYKINFTFSWKTKNWNIIWWKFDYKLAIVWYWFKPPGL